MSGRERVVMTYAVAALILFEICTLLEPFVYAAFRLLGLW